MSWRDRRAARRLARTERRLAKARDRAREDRRTVSIVPPEGVPLRFRLAGMGARLGAQLVDLVVTVAAALLLFLALVFAFDWEAQTLFAILALVAFLVRTPYYVASELAWNGRTLTKRWMGLRTVSRDGRSLRAYQVVVRNLLREIEFFAPILYASVGGGGERALALLWMVVVVVVPWRSPLNQRLGDIVAGTVVIEEPRALLLPDVAEAARTEGFSFSTAQLDSYGAYELQVLERLLRPPPPNADRTAQVRRERTLREVAERIRVKIGYQEAVPERETEAFLQSFYRAERAYLEQRKLFGDARADKSYREGA